MEQQFAADMVYLCRNAILYQVYSSTQQVASSSLKKVIQGIVYKEVALD